MPVVREKRAAVVEAVDELGPDLFRIDLCGDRIGVGVQAGQFAMLEAPARPDCILLRPFSYFLAPGPDRAAFLIKVVGKGTEALARAPRGTAVAILGPLGNGFPALAGETWLVAGGVGAAPFGELAGRLETRVLFGARTAAEVGFAQALGEVVDAGKAERLELATDDGSLGFAGSVVSLLDQRLAQHRPAAVFACGPTAMLRAVTDVSRRHGVPSWVSLEERMACGIGICRGCAHGDADGDWRCICEAGPVYEGGAIFAGGSGE